MYCINCGSQLSDNAVFCQNCGIKCREPVVDNSGTNVPTFTAPNATVTHAQNAENAQNPYTVPIQQPSTQPANNLYDNIAPYIPQTQENADSSKNGFSICALVLGIFGVVPCFINIIPATLALIFSIIGKNRKEEVWL